MLFLYSVLINAYYILIYIASFFNAKAKLWIDGRRHQFSHFALSISAIGNRPRIWIHVSSYGEFEMSKPLIDGLRTKRPDIHFIVSFYSPSGYERIALDSKVFTKIYLPLDQKRFHYKYLKLANPSSFIFIKYDFWFNLLYCLKERDIAYYFVSLHLESDSYLLKSYMRNFLNLLKGAEKIYVHSRRSMDILLPYKFLNLEEFGDLRIPQAIKNKEIAYSQNVNWKFPKNKTVIYGSVSKFELPYIIKAIKLLPLYNHIIALHDLDDASLKIIKKANLKESYLTDITDRSNTVLVVDNYGELKYLYKMADVAYVGGAFEKGPHNILEPLVFSIPVIIGPNIYKFPFTQECYRRKYIRMLDHPEDLRVVIDLVLKEENDNKKEDRIKFIKSCCPKLASLISDIEEKIETNVR